MDIIELDSGPKVSIYAVVVRNKCKAKDFISDLKGLDRTQLFAVFNLILQQGDPHNKTKFRLIGDHVYEIKTKGGIRMFCFKGNTLMQNSIILTHGIRKSKGIITQREKNKCLQLYNEFLTSDVKIIEDLPD